jgi:TolA-binding protein
MDMQQSIIIPTLIVGAVTVAGLGVSLAQDAYEYGREQYRRGGDVSSMGTDANSGYYLEQQRQQSYERQQQLQQQQLQQQQLQQQQQFYARQREEQERERFQRNQSNEDQETSLAIPKLTPPGQNTVVLTTPPSRRDTSVQRNDKNGNWGISPSCLPDLMYLKSARVRSVHGAYAVTKSINGGCGHSWGPRSMDTLRAEAMVQCQKYGSDCRIVYEQ